MNSRSPSLLQRALRSRELPALGLLLLITLAFWGRVLFTGQVLLPGAMLRGFLPFGGDPQAPWTILQWDSLAQYYPWRVLAARDLHQGVLPLWNPYQFTGTPLLANAQTGVFYPFNLPFWVLDTAYAFGVSAWLHSLLAAVSTYWLARRWHLSRSAAILAAVGFAFSGYLAAWVLLPTLAATASWLPLCLLLMEPVRTPEGAQPPGAKSVIGLGACLACALLAGHAQIFFYIVLALFLRQPFLPARGRAMTQIVLGSAFALVLGAAQLLPTLELARLGHRNGAPPSWDFLTARALQWPDLPALVLPHWNSPWGSVNENFPYMGTGTVLLAALGVLVLYGVSRRPSPAAETPVLNCEPSRVANLWFAVALAALGLGYALGTTPARIIFYGVPGVSMMGGTGRALLLWSLGVALLAAFGLDWLRTKVRFSLLSAVAIAWVLLELGLNAWTSEPTAPRATIYPQTQLTDWLTAHTNPHARVLLYTPRDDWRPSELLERQGRTHPPGILPPNGASVYGIYDVNGYDSLSLRQYREWIESDEAGSPSPAFNGNMVLMNHLDTPNDTVLDSLNVRYVVLPADSTLEVPDAQAVLTADGCTVWQRGPAQDGPRLNGSSFTPGWDGGVYQPESLRFGLFLSFLGLGLCAAAAAHTISKGAALRSRASSITAS